MKQGAWAEADGVFSRLLATPGNEGIYSAMLGVARSRAGRREDSVQEMERIAQLVSELPAAHRLYAEALYRAGRKDKAEAEARQAIAIDPLDHEVRRLMLTEAAD
jgi:tetratricopeptide (TPR) repeat protein